MRPRQLWFHAGVCLLFAIGRLGLPVRADEINHGPTSSGQTDSRSKATPNLDHVAMANFLSTYCFDCHNASDSTGGLSLESLDLARIGQQPEIWERVTRRLSARQMPPAGMPRPSEILYGRMLSQLESLLDEPYHQRPIPGRTETFRRLNRTEYRHAICDLLALDVDVSTLLPADESSHGFDNVTVADLSPTLLNRYISAAEKISRLAIGIPQRAPGGETIRLPPDLTQEGHVEGLPIGTRGGGLFPFHFPRDGQYEIEIRLTRDRNEQVEGLREPQQLVVLLNRELVEELTVKPAPRGQGDGHVDAHLRVRLRVSAGTHDLGVTFRKQSASLLETKRQPLHARFNYHRHPRTTPAIFQVSVTGPHVDEGPGDTPSRRRIFVPYPSGPDDELACAEEILSRLMRHAYRRPVRDEDLERPLRLFRLARADGDDFEAGIELALSAILVNPHFLFRIELDPAELPSGTVYQLSDIELASRLSFFLWSSIPDAELLDLAAAGKLSDPDVLRDQVARMLADERSRSLVSNFAGQWLYLRNLESITPDARLYPDFDDNLRQAFRRETELLVESILREDRGLLDLLSANETFLNERLARHYGIPHIHGSRFRKVSLEPDSERGGLLRHGSILTVTSYATRTSPVIRGQWVLKNLLGVPPPPPPPDIPELEENTVSAQLPVRERLAVHRANPTCASCHDLMDPVGLALENYDAVGRWRDFEFGEPVDASGGLPDGSEFTGVAGLQQGLLERPELLVRTVVEKLLTFALGRGVASEDAPAVRQIVREARAEDYRFSSVVQAIVRSPPFQMRTTP